MALTPVAYLPLGGMPAYRGPVPPRRPPTPWGKRIKERRERLNLTQQQLADGVFARRSDDANFTDQSIANLETGVTRDPKMSTLRDIAAVLGVSIDWIVNGTDYQPDSPATVDDLKRQLGDQIDALFTRLAPAAQSPDAVKDVVAQATEGIHAGSAASSARKRRSPEDSPGQPAPG